MKISVLLGGGLLCGGIASSAVAGPYATMAVQVKAHGGLIIVVAMDGLESQSATALDATAMSMCHTISAEGVTVTAVQIVSQAGQLIRLVSGSTLKGC